MVAIFGQLQSNEPLAFCNASQKMPKIDTLDALDDAITTTLTTNLDNILDNKLAYKLIYA